MTKKILLLSLFIAAIAISVYQSTACTNFLITKGATVDGSTMISYAADSHTLYGELYFRPAADYPEGTLMDIYDWDSGKYLGKIKQASHTYSVVGNMNEHQLVIGETTYGGLDSLQEQKGAVVDYGSLIYIALQRAKTAREAIKVMTSLVEEYGYASEGESFSLADPNEVWILEMIGKGNGKKGAVWVAQRIPDGMICGHANEARITQIPFADKQNCMYAPDVVSFAREKGLFKGEDKDFSFSDTYSPVNFDHARFSEARVWSGFRKVNSKMDQYLDYIKGNVKYDEKTKYATNRMPLWIKPDHKLSVKDVMEMMRDHYEGTPLDMTKDLGAGPYKSGYRWRPLFWKTDSASTTRYFNERAISTQQTGFSFVGQCRSWLPDAIGGIDWFGVDDTYSTVYMPLYSAMTEAPKCFEVGNGSMMKFSENSAFWIFNQVSNFAYTRYSDIIPEVRREQAAFESKFMAYTPAIDKAAQELYAKDPKLAVQFLTEYSVNTANATTAKWKELYQNLFMKYMDGNIKTVNPKQMNPNVKQTGYGYEWNKKIANETGDQLKVPTEKKK